MDFGPEYIPDPKGRGSRRHAAINFHTGVQGADVLADGIAKELDRLGKRSISFPMALPLPLIPPVTAEAVVESDRETDTGKGEHDPITLALGRQTLLFRARVWHVSALLDANNEWEGKKGRDSKEEKKLDSQLKTARVFLQVLEGEGATIP